MLATPDCTLPAPVALPAPIRQGTVSLEAALGLRRSVRVFRADALTLAQLGQLLWAAQGTGTRAGHRNAPSAGGLHPLELYVAAGQVDQLPAGVYHYAPSDHQLVLRAPGDCRAALANAALEESWLAEAPAIIAIAAAYERTTAKYGPRGLRYVHLDAGYAGENLCLQAAALHLGSTVVGAFDDDSVDRLLQLPAGHHTVTLHPTGWPH